MNNILIANVWVRACLNLCVCMCVCVCISACAFACERECGCVHTCLFARARCFVMCQFNEISQSNRNISYVQVLVLTNYIILTPEFCSLH